MQRKTQHILVIRPGALGDTLVAFPILQHLRTLSTQTHITVVGNQAVMPLVQAFQLADAIADYADVLWSQLFMPPHSRQQAQLYHKLKQIDHAICWLTDTDGLVKQNLQAAEVPAITIAPGRPAFPVPIVSYLAQSIGEVPEAISWHPPIAYQWMDKPSAEQLLRPIAIHPGSGGQAKCWPITHFATLIIELWRQNIPVCLLAGPADHQRIGELRQLLPQTDSARLLHLLQDAPLLTVVQELRRCQSYLGNDTGISHLAAMIGLPALVLFGPSDPIIWKPIGPTVTVLKTSSLAELTPHTVYTQLVALTSTRRS